MAGHVPTDHRPADHQLNDINQLRHLAQVHLQKIDQERDQEGKNELKKMQQLDQYAKHKRQRASKIPTPCDTPLLKMRSAQDVLQRLKWDAELDISRYLVGYLERFEGIKEMPVSNWIFESTHEDWIPQHRIRYFKVAREGGRDEVVWDRDNRVDKFFAAGANAPATGDEDTSAPFSNDGGIKMV